LYFSGPKGEEGVPFFLGGTLVYSVYTYLVYGFFMHFNRLYFLYCAGLGLSVYALILLGMEFRTAQVDSWFDQKKTTYIPAIYFLAITALFYFLWLSEDLPALISGILPKNLSEAGLVTNPIHILDLSIVLPAMAISSLQLFRKKAWGYLFFPIMMVFSVIMTVAIGGMMVAMKLKGVSSGLVMAYVFSLMALCNSAVLEWFLRSLKPQPSEF